MGIVLTDSIWCEAGEHYWDREPTRGRVPKSCPEHKAQAQPTRRERKIIDRAQGILTAENLIESLKARVEHTIKLDDDAYLAMRANPNDDIAFNQWLKTNGRLLNEVTALRSHEGKLEQLRAERSQIMLDDDDDTLGIESEDETDGDVEDEILAEFEEEEAA